MADTKENCIEWLTGQDVMGVTLTQERYINKVRRLKQKFPQDIKIRTNKDGSIYAKIPLSYLKLNHTEREAKEYTDEEKQQIRERLQAGKSKKQNSDWN